MGCPPDPVEIGIGRDNAERRETESKFDALGREKENALRLFKKIEALIPAAKTAQQQAIISSVYSSVKEPEIERSSWSTDSPYADAHEAWANLDFTRKKLKAREDSLCIIRDGILRLSAMAGPEKVAPLEKEVRLQKQLHQAHREDDRQTWLKWLADKEEQFGFFLKEAREIADQDEVAYLEAGIEKLRNEKQRVTQITTEEMIDDRDIFGRNADEFEIDSRRTMKLIESRRGKRSGI